MKKLKVDFENCYGIKKLQYTFDFSKCHVNAVYAPNGVMKSSFAKTFKDIAAGEPSLDRIFPDRVCKREVTADGVDLPSTAVFVVSPYVEEFRHSEKTSTLLVDSELRKEFETLYAGINEAKEAFLKAMKEESGSKKDLRREIASTFTPNPDDFFIALLRVYEEVSDQKDAPWTGVKYDTIFDDKVLQILGQEESAALVRDYVDRYNELLEKSTYFRRGIFNY